MALETSSSMNAGSEHIQYQENKLSGLSLFFPAYNEEKNIVKAVMLAYETLSKLAEKFEIIIVNDGSRDKTQEISEQLCKRYPHIHLVNHDHNKGYGSALCSGFQKCKYDYIFFTDADNQFDLLEIRKLIEPIKDTDIVAGYRIKRKDPFYRTINAWGFNMLVRLLFNIKIRDIDCAFKLFRKSVTDSINMESVGALINTEIIVKSAKKGFRIKQVGITHYPRFFGAQTGANPLVVLRAFWEIIKLWKRLR